MRRTVLCASSGKGESTARGETVQARPAWMPQWAVATCLFAAAAMSIATSSASAAVDFGSSPREPSAPKVEVLRDAFDISTARAEANLALQERGTKVDIVGQLEGQLGKDFAGVWFDNETGEFVVPIAATDSEEIAEEKAAVASEFAAAAIGDAYRTEHVPHAQAELEANQASLEKHLNHLLEQRVVQTAVDPTTNAVVVRVPEGIDAQSLDEIRQAMRGAPVNVELRELPSENFQMEPAVGCLEQYKYCDLPIRGGQAIHGLKGPGAWNQGTIQTCTLGFRANGLDGRKYLLTAGHCIEGPGGAPIWNWGTSTGGPNWNQDIGTTTQWHWPGKDWAKIDATGYFPDQAPWPTLVAYWGFTDELPITGEARSYVGQTLCHSGVATGASCGIVTAENVSWTYSNGKKVNGVFEMYGKNLCLVGGDSGGPMFASGIALGILSGGNLGGCNTWILFTDIMEAKAELNVNIAGPGAPEAVTGAPISVEGYKASVTGQVNPRGLATTYRFEYGQGGYSKSTFDYSAGAGQGFGSIVTTLPFLEPNADYKYRLRVSNSLNTSYGKEQVLKTPPVPPVVSTKSATNVFWKSAITNATIDPEGAETTYYIEYGTSTAYGAKTPAVSVGSGRDPVSVSVPISSLEFGPNYHYRVVATSAGGTSQGSDIAFTPGWSQRSVPIPAGFKPPTVLADVDCTTVAFCVSVGYGVGVHKGVETAQGVIASWASGAWTSQAAPVPANKFWVQLEAVDCVSAADCWAVGATSDGSTSQSSRGPLVAHWDGSAWQSTALPSPPGASNAVLGGISCASAASCVATGITQAQEGFPGEFGMRWDGSQWALTTNPAGALASVGLDAGDCAAVNDCYAPGSMSGPPNYEPVPFVNRWNGTSWARELVGGGSLSSFNEIDCVGPNSCVAAGFGKVGTQVTPFVGDRAGTWKATALPQLLNPQQDKAGYAHGLSCNTVTNCQMIGRAVANDGAETPLAARVAPNGNWERQTLPNLPTAAYLTAVSCPEPTFCAVVGRRGWSGSEEPISAIYAKQPPLVATDPATGSRLGAMKATEPFNGTAGGSVSAWATDWVAFPWTSAKGTNTATGYQPAASPTVAGAAYQRTVSDVGSGLAAQATMTVNPKFKDRYFALWADVPPSATTRTGYQLEVTWNADNGNKATVTLSKWISGTEHELSVKDDVEALNGETFALADEGSTVSAWLKGPGGSPSVLVSAADSTFSSGRAGVEGTGNFTRLTKFKVGSLLDAVPDMSAALAALAVRDQLTTPEYSLSGGGSWAAPVWINAQLARPTGEVDADGWHPANTHPTANGAYWTKAAFADTGAGNGVAVTVGQRPSFYPDRYLSFWINALNPGGEGAKSGYEVRFEETGAFSGQLKLLEWQAGSQTLLGAGPPAKQLTPNTKLAVTRQGGTITVWWNGSQEIVVNDSTFTGGFAAIEGSGNATRLKGFQAGQLPPF
jgi:hypothetical protein